MANEFACTISKVVQEIRKVQSTFDLGKLMVKKRKKKLSN